MVLRKQKDARSKEKFDIKNLTDIVDFFLILRGNKFSNYVLTKSLIVSFLQNELLPAFGNLNSLLKIRKNDI